MARRALRLCLCWALALGRCEVSATPASRGRRLGSAHAAHPTEVNAAVRRLIWSRDTGSARNVTQRSYGYVVSLEVDGQNVCGGTLLSPTWAMTAAHCVGISAEYVQEARISGKLDGTRWERGVNLVVVHPKFDASSYDDDVALLRLGEAAPAGSPTVQLVPRGFTPQPPAVGLIVGRGAGDAECTKLWDLLREGETRLSGTVFCKSEDQFFDEQIKLCSAIEEYSGEQGAVIAAAGCKDDGGPLLFSDDGKLVQVGIISYSFQGRDVFTRVAGFLDWISQTMQSPPAASALRPPACVNDCCDNSTFYDWMGRECSAWRGFDCLKIPLSFDFGNMSANETFRLAVDIMRNCPATCKMCDKCHLTNADCCDNRWFVDADGSRCSEWAGYNCSNATNTDGFTAAEQAQLLQECPLTCGTCQDAWDCLDSADFEDENGYGCRAWRGRDCQALTAELKYTANGTQALRENCPKTCNNCVPTTTATTTMSPILFGNGAPAAGLSSVWVGFALIMLLTLGRLHGF